MNRHILKRLAYLSLTFGLLLHVSPVFAQLAGGQGIKTVTLNDNVGKNQFTWISEAPLENIKGSSEGVSGSFSMDPKNLATIRGTVSTAVKTMKTGNETRDGHLMNAQWLDAGKYPVITFNIESVSDVKVNGNDATATAHGEFTMHGVTKKMAIPFRLKYLPANEKTKARASGDLVMINASFDIALKDFNVAGAKGLVGSKVGETIKVSAQLFGNTN
jgi:polyisoprenoid-binding protein YceI